MSDKRHPDEPRRVPVVDKRAGSQDGAGEKPAPPAQRNEEELAEARQLAEDRLDQLLRLKADFENFRKRVIREQTDLIERASLRIVEQLLPVFDDFERAVSALRTHADEEALVRGLEIVLE